MVLSLVFERLSFERCRLGQFRSFSEERSQIEQRPARKKKSGGPGATGTGVCTGCRVAIARGFVCEWDQVWR
jgi:hypothetical protein